MDFDQRRRQKWIDGRRERGLPLDGKFVGDPAEELQNEAVDIPNYADKLLEDGDISVEEADRYASLAREFYMHMEVVKQRRAVRLMTESRSFHAQESDDCYANA